MREEPRIKAIMKKTQEDLKMVENDQPKQNSQGTSQLQRLVSQSTDNIVMEYLHKRSEIMLGKLDVLTTKSTSTFSIIKENITDLEQKVKG